MPDLNLMFGLNYGVPDAAAKWGARVIVTQDGHVDFVPGRSSFVGEGTAELDALLARLEDVFPFPMLRTTIRSKLLCGELKMRERELVTLFDDGDLVVLANTNASAGYCYLAAYRRQDVPEAVSA